MKFGMLPTEEAAGAVLAHSMPLVGQTLRKGTALTKDHVAQLRREGIAEVSAARLEPGDVAEDEAAGQLAVLAASAGASAAAAFTGRANLHATADGVLVVDRAVVDAFNRIDPSMTLATLPAFARVTKGQMIATLKIITYAVPGAAFRQAAATASGAPMVSVAPFRPLRVGLIATTLPSLKASVLDKTRRVTERRLARAGAQLVREIRVAHEASAVGAALRDLGDTVDLSIVFGASATADLQDVVPAGIAAAGGHVVHFGMPVDPGNLLVLGELAGRPVIGAPGCARSPRDNGFDWILDRLLAGLEVGAGDITGMGVGGLLAEIPTRTQPRAGLAPSGAHIEAVVLAGGRGTRMGGPNKLLAEVGDVSLVRRVVEAALASSVRGVTVVTGHEAEAVAAALHGLAVRIVHNPDYAEGLSTSLRCGINSLSPGVDGALILLADMPFATAAMMDSIMAAYDPEEGALIVVPHHAGKRGNPVLWSRRFFDELTAVRGDTGGRQLIGAHADEVVEVDCGPAVLLDLDTPEALARAGGRLRP